MGLGQHSLSDGLIFLDRTSLPPLRMMEVLRCGATLEQRLLPSPAVLDRIDLVEWHQHPFLCGLYALGLWSLKLIDLDWVLWFGTYAPTAAEVLSPRHTSLCQAPRFLFHTVRRFFNCAECHNSAFLLSRPLAALELLESLTEPLVSTADSVMAVLIQFQISGTRSALLCCISWLVYGQSVSFYTFIIQLSNHYSKAFGWHACGNWLRHVLKNTGFASLHSVLNYVTFGVPVLRISKHSCSIVDKYQHMHFFTFNTVLV